MSWHPLSSSLIAMCQDTNVLDGSEFSHHYEHAIGYRSAKTLKASPTSISGHGNGAKSVPITRMPAWLQSVIRYR
jgi:hypothetical protein